MYVFLVQNDSFTALACAAVPLRADRQLHRRSPPEAFAKVGVACSSRGSRRWGGAGPGGSDRGRVRSGQKQDVFLEGRREIQQVQDLGDPAQQGPQERAMSLSRLAGFPERGPAIWSRSKRRTSAPSGFAQVHRLLRAPLPRLGHQPTPPTARRARPPGSGTTAVPLIENAALNVAGGPTMSVPTRSQSGSRLASRYQVCKSGAKGLTDGGRGADSQRNGVVVPPGLHLTQQRQLTLHTNRATAHALSDPIQKPWPRPTGRPPPAPGRRDGRRRLLGCERRTWRPPRPRRPNVTVRSIRRVVIRSPGW